MREALFYEKLDNGRVRCGLCPHRCVLEADRLGRCRARVNRAGVLHAQGYGQVSSLALDPIEKKPLYHFHPGSLILSLGGYGCNMRCPFCQNYQLSAEQPACRYMAPQEIADMALELAPRGNIGVAYTYNEPLISYEYLRDCADLVRQAGLKNVVVTNGLIKTAPLRELLPRLDAMNIDLKCFDPSAYRTLGGDLDTVKEAIALSAAHCHVEVTTLVVPGFNDAPAAMHAQCAWLAEIDERIPLHLSRFFPRYQLTDRGPTPLATLEELVAIARGYLEHVHPGNV